MGEGLLGSIPRGWVYTTLGAVCAREGGDIQTGPFGSQLHAADYVPVGIPSIMPQNIGDNRIIEDGIARITRDDADRLSRYLVRKGDIIYSRRGDVERRALVRDREHGWLCGTGCLRVRFGGNAVDSSYAAFYLGHPSVREWVVRHAHGATMPNLNTSILAACPFVVPPEREQRAIAHILGTLDDKIELNRQMNETLEAMARALFESWFVDFDPVRAKAEGRDAGLPKPLADLFPDSFEDSELGEIPKGWHVELLSDVMTFQGGAQPPANEFISESRAGYVRLVQIRDFYSSNHPTFVSDAPKLRKFTTDDIMIARYGSSGNAEKTTDSLARICRGLSGAYNVALVKVVPHRPIRECLGYFLRSPGFQAVIKGMGARSVQSGFRKEDLNVIPIVTASDPVHAEFERFAAETWRRTYSTQELSRTLAAIRDALLPKLISGEIRVNDADKIVEKALG